MASPIIKELAKRAAKGDQIARQGLRELGYKMFKQSNDAVDIHDSSGAFVKRYNSAQAALDDLGGSKKHAVIDDYRGAHQAPYRDPEGYHPSLDDLTPMYGDDIYTRQAKAYHGGTPAANKAIDIIQRARNNPDMEVTVYRAVPDDVTDINPRDWVSLTRDYAKAHGESALDGKYRIIETKTKASNLFNEGYVDEWGFDPKSLAAIGVGTGILGASSLTSPKAQAGQQAAIQELQRRGRGDLVAQMYSDDRIQAPKSGALQYLSDLLAGVETPIGNPYESTSKTLNQAAYGQRPSAKDLIFSLMEVIDPTFTPLIPLQGITNEIRKD